MSSRQEEKERRRKEREAQEAAAQSSAARKARLQLIGGVVVAVLAVGGITAAILAGGSDSGGGASGEASADVETSVDLPPVQIADLSEAAQAAGCTLREGLPNEGNEHLPSNTATFDGYKTNPPTSGTHTPVWAEDGVYEAGNEPPKELTVHALEHGRIEYQYKPGTPQSEVEKLKALWAEDFSGGNGYHQLVFQNQTGMEPQFAATAWTNMITCEELSPEAIDAFRAFREKYVDKGPEFVP